MPKFQVTVADEAGHKLYDERIEAVGPMEACAKAVEDAATATVAESAEHLDPVMPLGNGSRRPIT
ncbi:MAG: hypothetical protein ACRYGP_13945 [Janthinobacterium lividum]